MCKIVSSDWVGMNVTAFLFTHIIFLKYIFVKLYFVNNITRKSDSDQNQAGDMISVFRRYSIYFLFYYLELRTLILYFHILYMKPNCLSREEGISICRINSIIPEEKKINDEIFRYLENHKLVFDRLLIFFSSSTENDITLYWTNCIDYLPNSTGGAGLPLRGKYIVRCGWTCILGPQIWCWCAPRFTSWSNSAPYSY